MVAMLTETRRPIEDVLVGDEVLVPPKGTWRGVQTITAPDHNDILWTTFVNGHRHGFKTGTIVTVRRGSVPTPAPKPPPPAASALAPTPPAAPPATTASLAEITKRLLEPEPDPIRRWAMSRHAALAKC
jgi:hypothetical protein